MSSTFGSKIKISIFGESHQKVIGAVIDGLPAGFKINFEELSTFMARRAPGKSDIVSQRQEEDNVNIVSGVFNELTSDAPLCLIIENEDTNSEDYKEIRNEPRPGHADYTAWLHSNGYYDFRGGGHNSGRLTAPMCAAGNIIMQMLEEKYGIKIYARLYSIGGLYDYKMDEDDFKTNLQKFERIKMGAFPCISKDFEKKANEAIFEIQKTNESLGGIVEVFVKGMPAGIGEPMFDGIENVISQAVFAIPGVKGIEFGDGFSACDVCGSDNNDGFRMSKNKKKVETMTNHCGGILGGRTTGNIINFRIAFKPTPSIGSLQNTVNLETREDSFIEIEGRHDPCIAIRAVPVAEAAAAIAISQFIL